MPNTKQPQDHKTKATQPESEHFTWTAPDGSEVLLTSMDRIPTGVFRQARGLDEMAMIFALIEASTDEAGLEVIDRLPIGDIEELFRGWAEAGGVSLPE